MDVFALIVSLIMGTFGIPLVMVITGASFMKSAPREINQLYGYRTEMSMKNRETWEFAHRFYGRLSFIFGLILLPLTAVSTVFLVKKYSFTVAILAAAGVQMLLLFGSAMATEIALRITFDRDGGRKEK